MEYVLVGIMEQRHNQKRIKKHNTVYAKSKNEFYLVSTENWLAHRIFSQRN